MDTITGTINTATIQHYKFMCPRCGKLNFSVSKQSGGIAFHLGGEHTNFCMFCIIERLKETVGVLPNDGEPCNEDENRAIMAEEV